MFVSVGRYLPEPTARQRQPSPNALGSLWALASSPSDVFLRRLLNLQRCNANLPTSCWGVAGRWPPGLGRACHARPSQAHAHENKSKPMPMKTTDVFKTVYSAKRRAMIGSLLHSRLHNPSI